MKRWLRDAPIRQKLIALGLVASTCALIVASAVFLVTTYLVARRQTLESVRAQSAITADNITAALAFGDSAAANDTLRALRAMPILDVACAWNEAGRPFADYQPTASIACPASPPGKFERTAAGFIEVAMPIEIRGRLVGSLYIRANLSDVASRLRTQAVATVVALLLGALAAAAFAVPFQRAIAGPLTALAGTAHDISTRGDYSVRVSALARRDELGELVAGFNEMLQEIQRRDEELRTASRLKDEFLATVSHELRTPLNAILGWLQILEMTPPSEQRLERALTSLNRNARAQSRLIEDLLDVSRIVAGKLRLKLDLIDARHVVEAAVDVLRPAADSKNIQVETRIGALPHIVKGDADRLQQAVWNLLGNAVKFTEPGGRITVTLSHVPVETLITVEDTGIGIHSSFLEHVFEPFRQGDASSTRKYPGLGLGLAIVREITQAHGGHVEAFSDGPGRGAKFVLRLPTVHDPVPDAHPLELPATDLALRGVSALVVDDDADALETAAIALTERGAHVTTAADAIAALALIATRDVDVLITDLAMPEVDGYGLLDRLRAHDRTSDSATPVIALTAQASADEEARAIAAGFAAYLRKPYHLEDLIVAVATVARGATPDAKQPG